MITICVSVHYTAAKIFRCEIGTRGKSCRGFYKDVCGRCTGSANIVSVRGDGHVTQQGRTCRSARATVIRLGDKDDASLLCATLPRRICARVYYCSWYRPSCRVGERAGQREDKISGFVPLRGPVVSAFYAKLFYNLISRSIRCKFPIFFFFFSSYKWVVQAVCISWLNKCRKRVPGTG